MQYELCAECGRVFDEHRQGFWLDYDLIEDHAPDARWPTHEHYCDAECLQREIDRQRGIVFMSFEALKHQLQSRRRG